MASKDMLSWSSPKQLAWHVQTYSTIELAILCTSMVLIYNSELGVIISSEFFSHKETPEEALFTP